MNEHLAEHSEPQVVILLMDFISFYRFGTGDTIIFRHQHRFRLWHLLHVFPPLATVTFSCLSQRLHVHTFSRLYQWLTVFPPLQLHGFLPLAFPPLTRSLTTETLLTLRSAIVISNSFLVFDSFASRILSNFSRATA